MKPVPPMSRLLMIDRLIKHWPRPQRSTGERGASVRRSRPRAGETLPRFCYDPAGSRSLAPLLAVTFAVDARGRDVIADALGGEAVAAYLTDLDDVERAKAIRSAAALLTGNIGRELRDDELPLIAHPHLIQFISAGV